MAIKAEKKCRFWEMSAQADAWARYVEEILWVERGRRGTHYTCQRKCKPSRLGRREQIWFVPVSRSAGCSLTLFQKQKVSAAKDNRLQYKEFKPGKFSPFTVAILQQMVYYSMDWRLGWDHTRKTSFLCGSYSWLTQNAQWFCLGPETVSE